MTVFVGGIGGNLWISAAGGTQKTVADAPDLPPSGGTGW